MKNQHLPNLTQGPSQPRLVIDNQTSINLKP